MSSDEAEVCVFFNPGCSKCRGARDLLEEQGVEAEYYRYLDERPDRAELERVLGLLGTDDPRDMMRTGEAVYAELGLADADRDRLLDAMAEHPILIERPIVITGGRAVIARPPEKLLDLLVGRADNR
jgi:arsenate reductase